jgi:DNA modification methylase
MGVGSSLLAAIMYNRKAMGCEKEEIYVQITLQQIKDYYNGAYIIVPSVNLFINLQNEKSRAGF